MYCFCLFWLDVSGFRGLGAQFQVSGGWEPGFKFLSFSRPQTWFPQVGTRHAVSETSTMSSLHWRTRHAVSLQADVVICHLYSVLCTLYSVLCHLSSVLCHLSSALTKKTSKACSSGHYTILPRLLARDIGFEGCITTCQTRGYDVLRAYPP